MSGNPPTARRDFLKGVAAAVSAPALLKATNNNDKLGIAMIGVGTRGHYLLDEIQHVPNTQVRVICDLYKGNIARAKTRCTNPDVRIEPDWEKAIAAKEVDAVIIAAPDFWHAPMTLRAAAEKKDIYVEKGWCTRLDDAKKMRSAVKENKVVMQLGHHYNSLPSFTKAREIYRSGQLGKVAQIRLYIDRTRQAPEFQYYTDYDIFEPPKDASPETIDWDRYIANAPKRPFNVDRFFTWRRWWDYGTGIAGDLLSHLWDSANMVAGMGIPETAVTQGGIYFWHDGRDVPDQWNVLYDYPKQEMGVEFNCSFHNNHYGEAAQFLGRDKTLEAGPNYCMTFLPEWKNTAARTWGDMRRMALEAGQQPPAPMPDYVFRKGDVEVTGHMEDWISCVRSRNTPRCGVDRAFQEAAAILMSVEAWKQDRKVRWDPVKEEIV